MAYFLLKNMHYIQYKPRVSFVPCKAPSPKVSSTAPNLTLTQSQEAAQQAFPKTKAASKKIPEAFLGWMGHVSKLQLSIKGPGSFYEP